VNLSHIQIFCRGGGTKVWAATQSAEKENAYPEPRMFGETAAYGFYVRHVNSIAFNDVKTTFVDDEARAPFVLDQVQDAEFSQINGAHAPDVPVFVLHRVGNLTLRACRGMADQVVVWTQEGTIAGAPEPTLQPSTEPGN
jgi:hypothetical protein